MFKFIRAYRLEIRQALESRFGFASNFLIPILITILLAEAGSMNCSFCLGYTYFEYYAPLIFATTVMFISTQLMVLRIVGERAPYGTLDRDLLAISRSGMYIGKFLAGLSIAVIQTVLMVFVATEFYSMTMEGSVFFYLVILLLASITGLSFGLLLSIISKTKEQAVQLVPFIILILLVLSGELILFDDMPTLISQVSRNLPLSLAATTLKNIMLSGEGFQSLSMNVVKLLVWIVSLNSLAFVKFIGEK